MQEQFLQLWQQDPASGAYNTPWGICLRGRLDSAAMKHAVSLLAERHLVCCQPSSSPCIQQRASSGTLLWPTHDASFVWQANKAIPTNAGATHTVCRDCGRSAATDPACLRNTSRDSHSHKEWKSAPAAACCWWHGSNSWHQPGSGMAGSSGAALRLVQGHPDTRQGVQCAAHLF